MLNLKGILEYLLFRFKQNMYIITMKIPNKIFLTLQIKFFHQLCFSELSWLNSLKFYIEALYQIIFRLKLVAVISYTLLYVYLKLLNIFTRLKLSFII